ncbi:AMP-binding protein [Nocardia blacklockiae]|uniref:AMP-binding protein n=1 Tax=Nocardia blacklockiae TaxID=480036 RepID=UPI00189493C9|nr:class I adenylate-forming enzyme family protein [Nocardia blacklockiae]MBF6169875.1 acyl--CoA ligase [Nocardia blacklockiae]
MPKPKNIGAMLDWHADKRAQTVFHLDRPFDIAPWDGTVFDGAAAARLVHDAAAWLYAAGARPGARVAIVKDNHYDILLLAAAAARIGAVPALLSAAAPPETLRHLVAEVEPTVTVASAASYRALADPGREGSELGRVVVTGAGTEEIDDVLRFEDLHGAPPAPVRMRGDDEAAIVCHTSGTTGLPKLVVHSTQSLHDANRLDSLRSPVLASGRRDVFGSAISFVHARATGTFGAQLVHPPSKLVVLSDPGIENVTRVLSNYRVTMLEASPNVFLHWQPLTRSNPGLFERIRLYFNTFDLIHPSTVRAFLDASRRRFPLWLQGWGQSETGPLTAAVYNRTRVKRLRNRSTVTSDVGWTVPGFSRVRVVDPVTGARRRPGKPGLLLSAGRGRCIGYLGEQERFAEKLSGKWWNTGDLGYRDLLGRVRLLDREVDMIPGLSGIEIESTLLDRLPDATEVVVLGAPGRLPVPILCLPEATIDPDRWARATAGLPTLDSPIILPWNDIPRTSTWKVRRPELRELTLGSSETFGTGRWT